MPFHQNGSRATPRSVFATALSRASETSSRRDDRGLPDGVGPRLGHPLGDRVGDRADRGVDPGALDGRGLGQRACARQGCAGCVLAWNRATRHRVRRRGAAAAAGRGRNRASHFVTGQPVAERARSSEASSIASTTTGTPAASAQASSRSPRHDALMSPGWPSPVCSAIRRGCRPDVGGRGARAENFLCATRSMMALRRSSTPSPRRGRGSEDRDASRARPRSSSRRTSRDGGVDLVRRDLVDVVEARPSSRRRAC